MEWFSVASWLRQRVAILQRQRVILLLAAALTLCPIACGDPDRPTSPSEPGSPATIAQDGFIDGTVRDSSGPVAGALIEITGSPGGSATTNAHGVFSFKLPVGLIRLRSSKSGYYTQESDVIVPAGTRSSVNIVLEKFAVSAPVPQPPYSVRGVVRNGRGAVVPGAEVWIYGNSSPIDNRYGTTWADDSGVYSVTSQQRVPQSVRALKDGHIPRDVSIQGFPDATSTWTVDVVLVHIDRYAFLPPPVLIAGQSRRLETQLDLDDGSSQRGSLFMTFTSSDPSVVQVEPGGWVQGVAAGTATLTASYYGATATVQIRVSPSE
jgi:hypothetical protein